MFYRPTIEIDDPFTAYRGGVLEIDNSNADEYAGDGDLPAWSCKEECSARLLCWALWYKNDGKPNCEELKNKLGDKP